MLTKVDISKRFNLLIDSINNISVDVDEAYNEILKRLSSGNIYFIGNGGSAAIASHMAIDYTKNGGYKAVAFNDASALTCLGNDIGYENIFSFQMEKWIEKKDILFAISSSGESKNIINGVKKAKKKGAFVVTLSAFRPKNALSTLGHINFYVPTDEYGFAEITHLAILHSLLDLAIKEKA